MQDDAQKKHAKQVKGRYRELESDFEKSDLRLDIVHSQIIRIIMVEEIEKGEIPSDYSVGEFCEEVEGFLAQEVDEEFDASQFPENSIARKKKDEIQIIRDALGKVFGLDPEETKSLLPCLKVEEDCGTNIFDNDNPLKFGIVLDHEDKYEGLTGILKIFSQGEIADPVTKSHNIFKVITMDYVKMREMASPAINGKILYSMIADDLFRRLFRWSGHVKLDRPAILEARQQNAGGCRFPKQHRPSLAILRNNFPYFKDAGRFTDWNLEVLSRYMAMHGKGDSATLLAKGSTDKESDSSIFLVLLGQIDVKLDEDRTYSIKKGDVVGEYSFLTRYPRSYDVLHKNVNFLAAELHSSFLNCPNKFKIEYEVNKAYQLVCKVFEIIIESLVRKIMANNEYIAHKKKMDKLKQLKM